MKDSRGISGDLEIKITVPAKLAGSMILIRAVDLLRELPAGTKIAECANWRI